MRWGHWLFIGVLLAIPLVTGAYKIIVLDYRVATILPETEYRVSVDMSLDGNLS